MRLHIGLASMRERVSVAGGSLDIETAPEQGTQIRFSIPHAAVDEHHFDQVGARSRS